VPDSITLTNDSQQTALCLPWISTLAADLHINENNTLGVIDLSSLATSGGAIGVGDNASVGVIDLSSLTSVGGTISIGDNAEATVIDLSSLTNVPGDLTITSNAPDAEVDLCSLCDYGDRTDAVTMMPEDYTVIVADCFTLGTNGTLAGDATVDGSPTNSGTISPGASPGPLNFTGNLVLGSTNVLIGGTGGPTNGTYYVLASTNVGLPLASCTRIRTNQFGGSGAFIFTNAISPAVPRRVFALQMT
jgi:hypothetical protein